MTPFVFCIEFPPWPGASAGELLEFSVQFG